MNKIRVNDNYILIINVVIILIVTLTPLNGKIFGAYIDKLVHFSIFFALGFNVCRKYHGQKEITGGLLWAIVFGLMTEILQQVIPGRNMEFYDGLADTLGVVFGFYLHQKIFSRN